jgi:hypothetical protein
MTTSLARTNLAHRSFQAQGILMGDWREVLTPADREAYLARLVTCHPIYVGTTIEGINRLLDKRRGRAYVYTETRPGGAAIAFSILLLVTPDRNDPDVLKIVNAVPVGDYDPTEAAKILGRQVRRVLDQLGATSCFGTPMREYKDAKLNQYFRVIPELFWEMTGEEPSTNGKFRYRFKRAPQRRADDERFQGPGVPPRAFPDQE